MPIFRVNIPKYDRTAGHVGKMVLEVTSRFNVSNRCNQLDIIAKSRKRSLLVRPEFLDEVSSS